MAIGDIERPTQFSSWWGKAMGAGMIGGLAMGLYMMIVTGIMGRGFLAPFDMIAAAFPAYRPAPQSPAAAAAMGLLMHMITAAAWSLLLAWIAGRIPRLIIGRTAATLSGLVFGTLVWALMGEGLGPILSPPIESAPAFNFFLGHLLYGTVTARVFYSWAKGSELPAEDRMGGARNPPLGMSPT